ncbi:MAG TPA: NfeD family protein [Elusimicrobiales bacterium]|nr:NfeD family protein [Elusimicrobiales bacterium]
MLENIPLQYIWIILGIVIMGMELFLPGFILCFFGLGAVLTGLLVIFLPLGINTQLILFGILSIVLLVSFRRYAQGYFTGRVSNPNPTGAAMESHVGETAVVTEDIIPDSPRGKVEFHGTAWNADADTEIKKGTKVTILQRHDLTFKVKA